MDEKLKPQIPEEKNEALQAETKTDQIKTRSDANNFVIKPLRTYEEDVANFVKQGQISTAKIIVEEQKRKQKEEKVKKVEVAEKKSGFVMKISVFLVLAGIVIILAIVFYDDYKIIIPDRKIEVETFRDVLMDKKTKISIYTNDRTSSEIKIDIISNVRNRPVLGFGEIAEILLINKVSIFDKDGKRSEKNEKVSVQDVINFLDWTPPDIMRRALDEKYLFGIIGTKSGSFPFFLMGTKEFQNVYAGMLEWEPQMFRQVNDLFFQTLPADDLTSNPPKFVDIIIFNRDARALVDENGTIQFFYVFVDNNHILFGSKIEIVQEIHKKLIIENVVR